MRESSGLAGKRGPAWERLERGEGEQGWETEPRFVQMQREGVEKEMPHHCWKNVREG